MRNHRRQFLGRSAGLTVAGLAAPLFLSRPSTSTPLRSERRARFPTFRTDTTSRPISTPSSAVPAESNWRWAKSVVPECCSKARKAASSSIGGPWTACPSIISRRIRYPARRSSSTVSTISIVPNALANSGAIVNHMGNFFDCIQAGKTPISDYESQHRSATTCHLINLAIRIGRPLRWDAAKEEFVGDADANTWLSREQRKGFEVV